MVCSASFCECVWEVCVCFGYVVNCVDDTVVHSPRPFPQTRGAQIWYSVIEPENVLCQSLCCSSIKNNKQNHGIFLCSIVIKVKTCSGALDCPSLGVEWFDRIQVLPAMCFRTAGEIHRMLKGSMLQLSTDPPPCTLVCHQRPVRTLWHTCRGGAFVCAHKDG